MEKSPIAKHGYRDEVGVDQKTLKSPAQLRRMWVPLHIPTRISFNVKLHETRLTNSFKCRLPSPPSPPHRLRQLPTRPHQHFQRADRRPGKGHLSGPEHNKHREPIDVPRRDRPGNPIKCHSTQSEDSHLPTPTVVMSSTDQRRLARDGGLVAKSWYSAWLPRCRSSCGIELVSSWRGLFSVLRKLDISLVLCLLYRRGIRKRRSRSALRSFSLGCLVVRRFRRYWVLDCWNWIPRVVFLVGSGYSWVITMIPRCQTWNG